VGDVKLGQLGVRGQDDANRGRTRGTGRFEGRPYGHSDTITRGDVGDAGPNRDVDPERREVDAGGRSCSRVYSAPPSPGFPGSTTWFCG
jgi:hypothetical protein